jgi:hypothetical protein
MDEKLVRLAELMDAKRSPAEATFVRLEKAEAKLSKDISAAASSVESAVVAAVSESTEAILDEVKKKPSNIEFTYDLTPEETESLRGPKGDDGEPGADADEEEIIDRVIPEVLKAVPTAEEVAALVVVPDPIPGLPGAPGLPGKDGTEVTPDQVVDKVNASSKKIARERVDFDGVASKKDLDFALGVLDQRTQFLINKKVVKTVNGSAPDSEGNVTVSTGGDTSGLVPYTGATGDVDLGSNRIIAHAYRADATDGGRIESANGTLVGLFGPANTANVSWYGSHIFSTMTPGSVPFFGASGLLSQDNQNLYWDSTNYRLSLFSALGSELITNGGFPSASGWTFPSGWSLSGGKAVHSANGSGALTQSVSFWPLREYLLTYTVSSLTVGSFNVTITMSTGSYVGPTRSANGTYTERIHLSSPATALNFVQTLTSRFSLDDVSLKPLTGVNTKANLAVGGQSIEGSWSNGNPGTTRAQTFSNDGSYTWTDYRFSGVLRSSIGADSSGNVNMYASGSNYFAFYGGNSGLTSNQLFAYLYPTAFVHNQGYGGFRGGVHAGGTASPHSVLQSSGSFASAYQFKFVNFSADGSAATYYCDASTPSCIGTPSTTSCASYTASGQATCESHLPCAWFAGNPCSAFNGDPSSCSGQSGCSVDSASCAGPTDQTSCESQDDAYGGSCSFDPGSNTCPSFTNTSDCNAASPCYANVSGDCSAYSDGGGDGTACATYPECSYDSGTGACSGSFFVSCDGDNTSPVCNGTYNTGNCSGTYGQACTGTVSCASYSTSGGCGGEPGCAWTTAITVTMPLASTCLGRIYTFYNASSTGADVVIAPTSTDTINLSSTYTLASYKDKATFQAAADVRSCAGFSEGACTPSGCSVSTAACSWNSGDNTCSGDASCDGIGDQSSCEGTTYYAGCSGSYVSRGGWFLVGV